MRPPGGVLAPGESLIATGISPSFIYFSLQFSGVCAYLMEDRPNYILNLRNCGLIFQFIGSVQVCGASREQWETVRPEKQGQVQDYEFESERRNWLCARNGMYHGHSVILSPSLFCFLISELFDEVI